MRLMRARFISRRVRVGRLCVSAACACRPPACRPPVRVGRLCVSADVCVSAANDALLQMQAWTNTA